MIRPITDCLLTDAAVIAWIFARRTCAIKGNLTDTTDVVLGEIPSPSPNGVPLLDGDLHPVPRFRGGELLLSKDTLLTCRERKGPTQVTSCPGHHPRAQVPPKSPSVWTLINYVAPDTSVIGAEDDRGLSSTAAHIIVHLHSAAAFPPWTSSDGIFLARNRILTKPWLRLQSRSDRYKSDKLCALLLPSVFFDLVTTIPVFPSPGRELSKAVKHLRQTCPHDHTRLEYPRVTRQVSGLSSQAFSGRLRWSLDPILGPRPCASWRPSVYFALPERQFPDSTP